MTTSDTIRDYIKANPNCTNRDIAKALNSTEKNISARTSQLTQAGWLDRVKQVDPATQYPYYTYTFRVVRRPSTIKSNKAKKIETALPPMKGATVMQKAFAEARIEEPKVYVDPYGVNVVSPSIAPYSKSSPNLTNEQNAAHVQTFPHITDLQDGIKSKKMQQDRTMPPLFNQIIETVAETIAEHMYQLQQKVYEKFMAKMQGAVASPSAEMLNGAQVDDVNLGSSVPRKVLPKIGIVGMFPQQAGQLNAEFYKLFDITHLHADSNVDKLRAMARNCEIVFVTVDHVGHFATDTLKNNGANLKLIKGGLSGMKQALQEYYVEKSK